jgi:hypothetical protein
MSQTDPKPADNSIVIEGLVCEHRGDKHDKQYVRTDDGRYVYPQYLLQWFIGKRVRIVVTEVASPTHGPPGVHRAG